MVMGDRVLMAFISLVTRAYSRLGYANFYLGEYESGEPKPQRGGRHGRTATDPPRPLMLAAVVNYKRAIELDPSSTTNREYLEKAEQKLKQRSSAGAGPKGVSQVEQVSPG
jgi:hypothetical protein